MCSKAEFSCKASLKRPLHEDVKIKHGLCSGDLKMLRSQNHETSVNKSYIKGL